MRKVICMILAAVLCMGLACPVFADADNPFVPSVGYKDGPEITDAEPHGDCLVVTTVNEAQNQSTDIYQEDRDLLLEVHEALATDEMELPIEGDYVVRDLVDVSWKKTTCVEPGHGHKEWLKEDDTQIRVTFDLGVEAGLEIIVLVYVDGEWVPARSVKNNGDGTVTVVFDDICPVAFCVKRNDIYDPPKTGDEMGRSVYLFVGLMAASIVGLAVLWYVWRKKRS
ncbi:MAG: LPXTG cell wall anchor domain-containing protein [Oscillospiraceae bacterium]|nr:LPXTG cell wall anchor domain-containing protein [Oscillospiraceae bacterium]